MADLATSPAPTTFCLGTVFEAVADKITATADSLLFPYTFELSMPRKPAIPTNSELAGGRAVCSAVAFSTNTARPNQVSLHM